ncbi:MAG: SEC-C domain-containing protein [Chromatiales bacterium]|nr:SEC-C domain-containing protein [Chromatiales bacterium]
MQKQKTKGNKPQASQKQEPQSSSFTVRADGKLPTIMFDVELSPATLSDRNYHSPIRRKCRVMWSTGAVRSQLSRRLIEELSLEAIVKEERNKQQLFYVLDVYLPNRVRMAKVEMTEISQPLPHPDIGCIIGMDIISLGDCSLSHSDGNTFFSFRVPSLGGIDYVEQANKKKTSPRSPTMVRRNQMCPCGSGKRYKNCCGRLV